MYMSMLGSDGLDIHIVDMWEHHQELMSGIQTCCGVDSLHRSYMHHVRSCGSLIDSQKCSYEW